MGTSQFSRRWFLRATATATIALVAAQVLPVSAVPVEGALHQVIRDDVIGWLRAQWLAHVRRYGTGPTRIFVGPALFRAYEAELDAHQRFTVTSHEWHSLLFKGAPVIKADYSPWQIEMVRA